MSEPTTRRGIVVGVNGSDPCRAAVHWAARDAAMRNAPLTLLPSSERPHLLAFRCPRRT